MAQSRIITGFVRCNTNWTLNIRQRLRKSDLPLFEQKLRDCNNTLKVGGSYFLTIDYITSSFNQCLKNPVVLMLNSFNLTAKYLDKDWENSYQYSNVLTTYVDYSTFIDDNNIWSLITNDDELRKKEITSISFYSFKQNTQADEFDFSIEFIVGDIFVQSRRTYPKVIEVFTTNSILIGLLTTALNSIHRLLAILIIQLEVAKSSVEGESKNIQSLEESQLKVIEPQQQVSITESKRRISLCEIIKFNLCFINMSKMSQSLNRLLFNYHIFNEKLSEQKILNNALARLDILSNLSPFFSSRNSNTFKTNVGSFLTCLLALLMGPICYLRIAEVVNFENPLVFINHLKLSEFMEMRNITDNDFTIPFMLEVNKEIEFNQKLF